MADSILRLKVDSNEYDSKVKRASQGILELERTIREAGESFLATWKDEQEFAKGLGQMETVSKTARGKIAELTGAFTEMSMVYKRMTDEEKNSPFGQALKNSLDQLKTRIDQTKKDLEDVNKELDNTNKEGKDTSSLLDQLASKFGVSTKTLTTWGVAIAGAGASLKVAKDAFFASEQNLDDWNRMVYSSQSTYEAFLTSLNTGDVSGFLNRINTIVQAAQEAYNAIDDLQTTQNIQSPQVAKRQAELQRMETMLRTGRYIAPVDGRRPTPGLKEGDKLTKEQKDRIAKQVENIISEMAGLTKNEVKAATNAIDKLYNEQALRLGMTKQQFLAGTENIETFRQNVDLGKKYQEWENNRRAAIDLAKMGHYNMMSEEQKNYINGANPYSQYSGWGVFKDDGELYQNIISNIRNRSSKEQEYYSMLARSYRQINRVEGYKPYGGGTGSQLTDPEKAQQKYEQALKDYNQALEQAALETKAGTLSTVDAKKKELSAEETLWKAIGDAREIYDTDQLKQEQDKVAAKVVELGGSVNALVEEQKAAQEAARELVSAQKKLSDAEVKMADALKANDYKAYTAAYKQYTTQQTEVQRLQPTIEPIIKMPQVEMPSIPTMVFDVEARTESALDSLKDIDGVTLDEKTLTVTANTTEALEALNNVEGISLSPKQLTIESPDLKTAFSYTQNNMSAFIAKLNEQLADADVGSELFNALTAQIADAQTLANLMETAVKNGVEIAEFEPQELFNKIFGDTPGDYIDNIDWQAIQDAINEKLKEMDVAPIELNFQTGDIKKDNEKSENATKDFKSLIGNVSTITGALKQIGVDVPEGFAKTLGVMQVITTILVAIQSLSTITATTSALKSIPIIGWFLQQGGVIHAQEGFNGIVPGNMFTGDNIPALLNSGETVLTAAQSASVANLLTSGGGEAAGASETRVESDELVLTIRNGAARRGMTMGEYLGL